MDGSVGGGRANFRGSPPQPLSKTRDGGGGQRDSSGLSPASREVVRRAGSHYANCRWADGREVVAWYIQNSQCHVCRWQENKVIMANGLVACCLHAPMDPSPTCIDDTLDLAASLQIRRWQASMLDDSGGWGVCFWTITPVNTTYFPKGLLWVCLPSLSPAAPHASAARLLHRRWTLRDGCSGCYPHAALCRHTRLHQPISILVCSMYVLLQPAPNS